MQKPFRDGLADEDRRLVRRWTVGLFAFYGLALVVTLTVARLTHHPSTGPEVASAQLTSSGDQSAHPLR